jgi:opacity protein-like surface antigen
MRKLFAVIAIAGIATSAHAAKDLVVSGVGYGSDNYQTLNYKYKEGRSQTKSYLPFYVGAGLGLNFNNFKTDSTLLGATESESYSFKQTTGFELMGGYQFAPRWRAELNYGQSGEFSKKDSLSSLAMSMQWMTANVHYMIQQWTETSVYAGLGAGAAMLKTEISSLYFDDSNDTENNTTFTGMGILGIEQSVSSNISIMAEYRLRYTGGAKHERVFGGSALDTTFGGIITNSIVIGARVKF